MFVFRGLAGDTVSNMSPYENTIWNIKVKAARDRMYARLEKESEDREKYYNTI
jgi:hypothetical protein